MTNFAHAKMTIKRIMTPQKVEIAENLETSLAKAIEAVNPDVRFSVLSLAFASEYRYAKENDSDSSISS